MANTGVERGHSQLQTMLAMLIQREDQSDWDNPRYWKAMELAIRRTPSATHAGLTPNFILYGVDHADQLDLVLNALAPQQHPTAFAHMDTLRMARQLALLSQVEHREKAADIKNKHHSPLDVEVGSTCEVFFPNVGQGRSVKLAWKLHGPYRLTRFLQEEKRSAELVNVNEPKDVITAPVAHIRRIREVEESARLPYIPCVLDPVAHPADRMIADDQAVLWGDGEHNEGNDYKEEEDVSVTVTKRRSERAKGQKGRFAGAPPPAQATNNDDRGKLDGHGSNASRKNAGVDRASQDDKTKKNRELTQQQQPTEKRRAQRDLDMQVGQARQETSARDLVEEENNDEFVIDKIVTHRDVIDRDPSSQHQTHQYRMYKVRWRGYGPTDDTEIAREYLLEDAEGIVDDYEERLHASKRFKEAE